MSDAAAIDRNIDTSKMQISDEVAIQISAMNKWYGSFHVLRDINMTVNRASGSSFAARPGRANPR